VGGGFGFFFFGAVVSGVVGGGTVVGIVMTGGELVPRPRMLM
jgi:hypothetical protein